MFRSRIGGGKPQASTHIKEKIGQKSTGWRRCRNLAKWGENRELRLAQKMWTLLLKQTKITSSSSILPVLIEVSHSLSFPTLILVRKYTLYHM